MCCVYNGNYKNMTNLSLIYLLIFITQIINCLYWMVYSKIGFIRQVVM